MPIHVDRGLRAHPRGLALIVLMAAVWLLVAPAAPASACSCAPSPPPAEARAQAAAVFTGTVVTTRTLESDGPLAVGAGDLVARAEVEEVFGGSVPALVDVTTPTDDGLCGLGFAAGDRWLVYAGDHQDGGFSAHDCTRTAALAYAQAGWETSGAAERDLAVLGASTEPPPGEQLRAEDRPPWLAILTGALLAVVAVAAVAVTWSVRRPARG